MTDPIVSERHQQDDELATLVSARGLAIVGVLLMLLGSAFFLELSFTRGWVSPAARLALGLVAGTAIMAASLRFLIGTYRRVAEASTALGAGIVYLVSWAALVVFPELHVPRLAAFALMVLTAAVLTAVAARRHSQAIALMGLCGAYLTPLVMGQLMSDRMLLAAYLFIVTSGLLLLAVRRTFVAVECLAVLATLLYSTVFWPDSRSHWSADAAAVAASLFFALYAVVFSLYPPRLQARIAALPVIAAVTIYLAVLELLLHGESHALGAALSAFTVLAGAASRLRRLPDALRVAYRASAVVAGDLAIIALFLHATVDDVFALQAATLCLIGARRLTPHVTISGLVLFAATALDIISQAVTAAPAQLSVPAQLAPLTSLNVGFGVWCAAAYAARDAVPQRARRAFALALHAVMLVGLTRVALDVTGGDAWNTGLSNAAQLSVSLIWAAFGALLFGRGLTLRDDVMRWEGLALFALVTVKVFAIDLTFLDLSYRVLAFIGTGSVFFGCSVLWSRSMRAEAQMRARSMNA